VSWQDLLLAIGSISFSVALVPTLRSDSKPALSTCVVTAVWLAVFTIVYATLSLWLAAVTSAVSAAMWFVLAAQVFRRRDQTAPRAARPGRLGVREPGAEPRNGS
jgi:hypothetical protein